MDALRLHVRSLHPILYEWTVSERLAVPERELICELCAVSAWEPVGPGLLACRHCRVVYAKPPDEPTPSTRVPGNVQPSPPSLPSYGITPKVRPG